MNTYQYLCRRLLLLNDINGSLSMEESNRKLMDKCTEVYTLVVPFSLVAIFFKVIQFLSIIGNYDFVLVMHLKYVRRMYTVHCDSISDSAFRGVCVCVTTKPVCSVDEDSFFFRF